MKILLLNVSYEPLRLISLEDAICKVYSNDVFLEGDARFSVAGGTSSSGERSSIVLSQVIRNKTYDKASRRSLAFDRKILFLRDSHTCVYCGRKGNHVAFTRDHVIPKAALTHGNVRDKIPQGKRHLVNARYIHSWANSVTCCRKCNNRKGHTIPAEKDIISRRAPTVADAIYLKLNIDQKDIFSSFIHPFLKAVSLPA